MAVAGQGALGQQVAARDRTGRVGPPARGPVGREGGAGRRVRVGQVGGHRSDDDGPVAEVVEQPGRGLERVGDAAEDDDEPLALGGAEGVHVARARRAAYGLEDVELGPVGRHGAQHHGDVPVGAPPEGARAGEHGLVGLGAHDGVDHEGLETGVPRAARLRGTGVDGRGREGDLAGVEEDGVVDLAHVLRVEQRVDVGLDDPDAEPDQLDGLLERDDAGQLARRGAEHDDVEGVVHGARDVGAPGRSLVCFDLDVVPLDEAADAGLHDQPDPGAVLRAEVVEPRQVGGHPCRRGRAERSRGVAQRLGCAAAGGGHGSTVVADRA